MRRLHLIELEDQPWCPAVIRNAATDYLRFMLNLGNNYGPAVPVLARAWPLQRTAATCIVDLCSGGGGPWVRRESCVTIDSDLSPSGRFRYFGNTRGANVCTAVRLQRHTACYRSVKWECGCPSLKRPTERGGK
ncbi:MAG: hypothetical protein ABI629_02185 [bacterium]